MGMRFRRRVTLLPGVRLNISKSGVSTSIGPRGASVTVSKSGVYRNIGLPGTGLSHRQRIAAGVSSGGRPEAPPGATARNIGVVSLVVASISLLAGSWGVVLLFGGLAVLAFYLRAEAVRSEQEAEDRRIMANEAERQRIAAEAAAHFEALRQKYGDEEVAARIRDRVLWVGETAEQVLDSMGEPDALDHKVLKTKKREVWKYGWEGANRYRLRVTFDNGVVTGWTQKE